MIEKGFYNLTDSQKNIWDTELYFSNSSLNNVGGYVLIKHDVDIKLLEKAVNLYVKKNDALRIQIKNIDNIPYQHVLDYSEFNLDVVYLKDKDTIDKKTDELMHIPFSIVDSCLYNCTLFKLNDGTGGFVFILHHLISDAWNMSLLISEIMDLYSDLVNNRYIDDSCFPSYVEYIKSNENYMKSSRFKKDDDFWKSQFDKEPSLSYITSKNKQEVQTESVRKIFELPNDLYEKINSFCKEHKSSIYTFFMAIYSLYVANINNVSEPILGTPVLNRSGVKEKHTAGMFISTVPFKVSIDKNSTFCDFLKEVSTQQLSVFRHQKYPYNELLQSIKKKYNLSENLYDMVLSYQNARDDSKNCDIPYSSKWVENGHTLDSLEIHFYDMDNTGTLSVFYDYQINKFTPKEIEDLHSRILTMVETVLVNPSIVLRDIKITNKSEEDFILNDFNSTFLNYDKTTTILDIFNKNVKEHSFDTALVFENESYNYFELDNMSNRFANFLLSLKLPKNSIIGVMLNRSVETIFCMLGILKANMAYMLIDHELPEDRISFMLKNASVPLLVTSSDVPYVNFDNKVYLDSLLISDFDSDLPTIYEKPDDYLSVVYTSGSTGQPKGVLLKRYSMVNLVNGYRETMNIDDFNCFLSICSVSFDMFAAEVWIALLSGKKLVLANEEQSKNPIEMSSLINKENCEFMLITSSKLDLLLSNTQTSSCLKKIKAMQLGGEVLNPAFYNKLIEFTDAKIYNGYGPSETTSCCSCKFVSSSKNISLGKPLPNTQLYVCTSDLKLCPIGVSGELCIAGDGVSFGYINNKEDTDKHFVKNPFGDGLLYKSGDLARLNSSGEIEYIGRNDFQVKFRGLRIELEEITSKLLSIKGIDKCVTVIHKVNGVKCICSFIVSSLTDISKIKTKLSSLLPHYMIPSHIVILDELPLSSNGKIDRSKLPDMVIKKKYVAPKTKMQKYVASIFEKFLNVSKVSIDSDFFELGGDSLIAIKIITQINCDLGIDLSIKGIFENTSVSSLSKYISSLSTKKPQSVEKNVAPKMNSYPATSAQKRIFYSIQSNKRTLAYNTPGGLLFDKTPSIKKLERCFTKLIKRHEALRTYFVVKDTQVEQKFINPYKFKLDVLHDKYINLDKLFINFVKPFDLSNAPLFRVQLVVFENGKSVLFTDFHHIICDGASISIFIKELCDLYNRNSLDDKDFDYKDFSIWEQKYLKSDSFEKDKFFWLNQFKGELPVLEMPTTFKRSSNVGFSGSHISYELLSGQQIIDLCKDLNTTPYMFLLSVYYILLYKYTNQTDIVVGTALSGRDIPEVYGMLGMFVNTLALRSSFDVENSFKDFLLSVTTYCLEAFEHSKFPFDKLVEDLDFTRDMSRNPIFDTMFVYQNEDMPEVNLNKINTNYYIPNNNTSKFDFLLEVIPKENSFKLNLEYKTKLFNNEFMEFFVKHFEEIVNQVIANQDIKLKDIKMLNENEKNSILNIYSGNDLDYPKDKSIIELFEEQALKTPRNTAIIYKGKKYSYSNLRRKVNAFAYYLCSHGVSQGDIVGTLLERSDNLIIAMLGIMKCGAVYLPISTQFPKERIEYIIKNSKLHNLIVDKNYKGFDYGQTLVNIDNIDLTIESVVDIDYNVDDAIYSIYTSGSTGNPKGVLVTNRNLNNFIHSFNKLFDNSVDKNDIAISTTNICFDVSIWEFFFSLLNGASLYLYEHETIEDIFDFCNTLMSEHISLAYLPPNILNEVYNILNDNPKHFYLEKILLGVEPIRTSIVKKFYDLNPNIKIVNGYGPTETTICSTAFVVKKSNLSKYTNLPIGKPLYNLNAYVLDKDLFPVPIGVPGELYISGDNVTKGYLNNPRMTADKYISCPFEEDSVMYSTGDVVKILPDGNLSFIGRNDNQVKIKGHRIELNEISNSVSSYPGISKCFIIVKRQKIAAYFIADVPIVLNDLRSFLSLKLPVYSIPNYFVQLESFPLTINGKIDKKQLDKIELKSNNSYEAPRNDFEQQLCDLWKEFLDVDKVGINDNFFDLGGDSLIAIRMQIDAFRLGLNISYSDIFAFPTIKQLSEKISNVKNDNSLDDFDYTNINKLLEINNLPIPNKFRKTNYKNILLTGATGFIGVHILDRLLTNTKATIYCLVRSKNNESTVNRLIKVLDFYFGNKYDKFIGNRIKIIDGDVSFKHFGMNDVDYQKMGKKLSCVINCAAIVKHYGMADVFNKTNIGGAKNIIDLCNSFNIPLYHLSTLSVSGNAYLEGSGSEVSSLKESTVFKEHDLFINQKISNVYVYSKFMAERIILDNVYNNGLKATIIRLGNITSRYSDGKFQINISENAYLNRLLSFIKLGAIPDYMLEGYGEFTPVDYVADAISKIIQVKQPYNVLHLYNDNHIPMEKLISIFSDYGIDMKVLPEEQFLKIVNKFMKKDKEALSGIINDFDNDKKLEYNSNIVFNSDFTNEFLSKLSFKWCSIGRVYLFRYLDYLKDLGLI